MRVLMVVKEVRKRRVGLKGDRERRERGRERLLTVVERVDRAWVAGLANANMLSSR